MQAFIEKTSYFQLTIDKYKSSSDIAIFDTLTSLYMEN